MHSRIVARLVAALALLFAAGCGDVDDDPASPGADASVPDQGVDAPDAGDDSSSLDVSLEASFDLSCPKELTTGCAPWADKVLEASALGVSRFFAIDRDRALAERVAASGTEPVVVHVSGKVAALAAPEPLEPRDITDRWVLLCKTASCSLYSVSESETEIVPLPGGQVPDGLEPSGMVAVGDPPSPCLHGNGVACHSAAGWTERVPAGGPAFRAASADGEVLWAVGDSGRIVRSGPSGWTEYPPDGSVTLTAVAVSGERVLIGRADGSIRIFGDASLECSFGAAPILAVGLWSTGLFALDATGRSETALGGSSWCTTQPFGSVSLVGVGRGCFIGSEPRAVTQGAAYLRATCPVP